MRYRHTPPHDGQSLSANRLLARPLAGQTNGVACQARNNLSTRWGEWPFPKATSPRRGGEGGNGDKSFILNKLDASNGQLGTSGSGKLKCSYFNGLASPKTAHSQRGKWEAIFWERFTLSHFLTWPGTNGEFAFPTGERTVRYI